ncbi:hypothetical protein UFOVP326_69 [uncultured Caudovirales phage]|uniref:Uncharacterized protein n=1 Tax=uncultured Caudovirales phage TaxID=2100421 RepID=A0A6J5LXU1_9CAUD|nr:hypothetical protein UFOVP326_69 [uncultured Caudovirales phage]
MGDAPKMAECELKRRLREQGHMREGLRPHDYAEFVGILAVQWVELELARVCAPLVRRIGELETLLDRLTALEEQHEPLANEMRAMLAKIGAALDAPDPLEERLAAVEAKLEDVSARASGADYPGLAEAVGQLQSAVTGTDAATLRDRLDATEKRLAVLEAKAEAPLIQVNPQPHPFIVGATDALNRAPPLESGMELSDPAVPATARFYVPSRAFGAALELMRAGARVRRASWTQWESIGLPLSTFRAGGSFDVRQRGAVGAPPLNVILTLDDMLATDWEPA